MPRVGLTAERVVDEAARLVDERGLDALHLGLLAERLGVRTPSLYKHVAGLPELRRRLALAGIAALDAALAPAGDDLAALGRAYRRFARDHPGLYAATVRAPDPGDAAAAAGAQAIVDRLRRVVAAHGVRPADEVHAVRVLRSALHGFVTLEAAGGFGLPEDVEDTFERLLAALPGAIRAIAAP